MNGVALSISWKPVDQNIGFWLLVFGHTANEWVDGELWDNYWDIVGDDLVLGEARDYVDYQWTSPDSVCIDANATGNEHIVVNFGQPTMGVETALMLGSIECLDQPDWVFR